MNCERSVQKVPKSGLSLSEMQNCIIFTLVSFLGNTVRMFKGCGKEKNLLLKKLALAGIQTAM